MRDVASEEVDAESIVGEDSVLPVGHPLGCGETPDVGLAQDPCFEVTTALDTTKSLEEKKKSKRSSLRVANPNNKIIYCTRVN